MKKLLLLSFLCLGSYVAQAQVDLQVNPIGLFFSDFNVSSEFAISQDFGIEGGVGYQFDKYKFDTDNGETEELRRNGFGVRAIGKYYFAPNKGIDRWNIGAYMRFGSGKYTDSEVDTEVTSTRFAAGFWTGYKWVSRKNVVFELGLGLGRAFVNKYSSNDETVNLDEVPFLNWDISGKLSVGIRLNSNKD